MTTPTTSTLTIGRDLTVGRIGFGAMQLTGKQVWGEYPDHNGGIALLRAVVDAGVTFIDTADVYGPHSNELLIRAALHPYPENLVIATKGGFVRGGYDYSTLDAVGNPNYLRQSAYMSARRLGVDSIDLYYLHSGQATDVPFEDQVATLAALKEEGLIRHIGLSNVTVEQFELAQTITPIAAATALYNPGIRRGVDLLRATEKTGAVFSPWHPMSIADGGEPERITAALDPIAQNHDATVQQVALAWHLHRAPNTLPIPGTTSLEHLRTNLAAAEITLTSHEVAMITDLASEG
ncbi:aldo/keto reductase [Curtobacterium sp. SORGH_AS_0776]|jgi:aryl-alcohol dehydrogenase-like predicted oxidoreductase|uniref:aldo/keto reductase n=1 Tax=Curtobacterium sp. SORGH_AS_0776 TaxID=3041798 RepID=UPI0028644835|nr:aldo/keto reductase [Curtobacterium sp. SORGH_AS_0776]MDR6170422.1 aryl-alcohol dehydrogenase-like predicted oxidoreductase [Curtobacterium sp. SORGH_AS_0776]